MRDKRTPTDVCGETKEIYNHLFVWEQIKVPPPWILCALSGTVSEFNFSSNLSREIFGAQNMTHRVHLPFTLVAL